VKRGGVGAKRSGIVPDGPDGSGGPGGPGGPGAKIRQTVLYHNFFSIRRPGKHLNPAESLENAIRERRKFILFRKYFYISYQATRHF